MKILSAWLRAYLPTLAVTDRQLADDLTLRGIAVEGVFDLAAKDGGAGNGSLFEMDITTNRVDAMNHYGIAREAAAIYNIPLASLDTALPKGKPIRPAYPVSIEAPDLCGRFTARVLRNVHIAPSTADVAERFAMLEQKQISNAVDATNFVTLAMGHPTHAFDLDKVEGGLVLRRARKGERLKLLDGTERTLVPDDLVVADERKALALAGVMGGWDTMITPQTKNILVEAAWFDPATVRRSSRRHGLHTDASHRFERGADFAAPPVASALVCRLILAAGGEIEGELVDVIVPAQVARTVDRATIQLAIGEVARILGRTVDGQAIDAGTIERYLTALGCRMAKTGDGTYSVHLPSWRLDLEREIDLIEEIARLHGYNRFANTLPSFAGSVVELPTAAKEHRIRYKLLGGGYTEAISSTFCSVTEAVTFTPLPDNVVPLGNPLSEEAGCLRPSLVPGMLAMLAHNLNHSVDNVRLFEMGTVFLGSTDRVHEHPALAMGATGTVSGNVHGTARPYSFYDMKGAVEELLSAFAARSVYFDAFPADAGLMPKWLHPGRAARVVADGSTIGYFGQLAPQEAVQRKFKQDVFVGELDLERLFRQELSGIVTQPISRFPAVVRDFSFIFRDTVRWEQIAASLQSLGIAEMRRMEPLEIFRDARGKTVPQGSYSLLVRTVFQSQERTLRDEEIQNWSDQVIAQLTALGGILRG
ncbi:MAG TPA: phenylalanine--tRNA ligase subunit beta [Acidobacteriaceae bacterium]|jgi:phenylalanyl-tRNA synthetase beta chain|nr:phenylalanine--tRNA ligase subunit beta [Acidobacteriaceae bacterium]